MEFKRRKGLFYRYHVIDDACLKKSIPLLKFYYFKSTLNFIMFRIKRKRAPENNLCSRKRPNQSFSIPEKVADKKVKKVATSNIETGYLKVNEEWASCSTIEEMRDRGPSEKEYEFCTVGDFLTETEIDSTVHSYEGQFEPPAASSPKSKSSILMSEDSKSAPDFEDFITDEPAVDIDPFDIEEDDVIDVEAFNKSKEISRPAFQIYKDHGESVEKKKPEDNDLTKKTNTEINTPRSRKVFKTLGYYTVNKKNAQICTITELKDSFKFI